MNTFAPPQGQPGNACGRYKYETGQGSILVVPGVVGAVVNPQNALEAISKVNQIACFMTQLDVTLIANEAIADANLWIQLYDVQATDDAVTALQSNALGAARYNYGPFTVGTRGVTFIREPQELFTVYRNDGRVMDQFLAQPFDNGILLAISATPITYEEPALLSVAHVVVRMRQA